jgi:hypothetical protein
VSFRWFQGAAGAAAFACTTARKSGIYSAATMNTTMIARNASA